MQEKLCQNFLFFCRSIVDYFKRFAENELNSSICIARDAQTHDRNNIQREMDSLGVSYNDCFFFFKLMQRFELPAKNIASRVKV